MLIFSWVFQQVEHLQIFVKQSRFIDSGIIKFLTRSQELSKSCLFSFSELLETVFRGKGKNPNPFSRHFVTYIGNKENASNPLNCYYLLMIWLQVLIIRFQRTFPCQSVWRSEEETD